MSQLASACTTTGAPQLAFRCGTVDAATIIGGSIEGTFTGLVRHEVSQVIDMPGTLNLAATSQISLFRWSSKTATPVPGGGDYTIILPSIAAMNAADAAGYQFFVVCDKATGVDSLNLTIQLAPGEVLTGSLFLQNSNTAIFDKVSPPNKLTMRGGETSTGGCFIGDYILLTFTGTRWFAHGNSCVPVTKTTSPMSFYA